jgi:hypothetical protein
MSAAPEKSASAQAGPLLKRIGLYENLIDMLAVEAELCYPEQRIHPGPAYDEAIKKLSMVIRAKGKIHAFYILNCRQGVVPGAPIEGEDSTVAAEFFKGLFQELEADPDIQGRVYEAVQSAGSRVLSGIKSERRLGSRLGMGQR